MADVVIFRGRKAEYLLELQKCRGLITTACSQISMSTQTVYKWRKADEEFERAIQTIIELQLDKAETVLLDAIEQNDLDATKFYLRTKGRSRGYGDKIEIHTKDEERRIPAWFDSGQKSVDSSEVTPDDVNEC